jgi:2,3-diketo-5-methylthiopentyl-1-phosphate enolase
MVKELYDPHMFNYMWESLDQDRFVVGTYYIEDSKPEWEFIDHLAQVERLALEGSTATWMDIREETPEVRDRLSSKVLGYYEIPAPKGTKKAIVQLGFPIAAWEQNVNVPMMMLSISGNIFAFCDKVRMLDVYIPKSVAQKFPGPKFGIEGVRDMLGVHDRPLLLQIIKPKTLYMVSITDEVSRIHEKALRAVRAGATGLLIAYSAGLSALKVIAEDPEINVPILWHVSHMLGMLPTMSFPVLAKLARLCGADMMLVPSLWSSLQVCSVEEEMRTSQVLRAPFYHFRRTWPMPAAGMYPGVAEALIQEHGIDFLVPAGGGILGHPMGYKAGAMAWRQAFDAVLAGKTLQEAAQTHTELRVAAETWGIRERPKSPWAYHSPELHPKFGPKNL